MRRDLILWQSCTIGPHFAPPAWRLLEFEMPKRHRGDHLLGPGWLD